MGFPRSCPVGHAHRLRRAGHVPEDKRRTGAAPVQKPPVPVLQVEKRRLPNLVQVRKAGRLASFFAGLCREGNEQRRQRGQQRDHDQQFQQREAPGIFYRGSPGFSPSGHRFAVL